jgi:uncharacterized surface protein with fasciclin (FAS1) repeats
MQCTDSRLVSGRTVAVPVIALALALTGAACGSTASPKPAASQHAAASPSESMTGSAATIGADCGMIPATGMGSMHSMAMDPVVTAARHDPLTTTLAAEVGKAGLTKDLNSASNITVFAPENKAFKMLTAHDMTMMSGMKELATILRYHVVRGRITPAELASGKTLTTLAGTTLKTARMGSTYEVNNAAITCGNLHTANATVYVINKVLMPSH